MKTWFKALWLFAVLGGMVWLYVHTTGLLARAKGGDAQVQTLRAQVARLQADLTGAKERTEAWAGRMATQSNEIHRLLTEYEDERKTTEPLRRQIEAMLTQEIRLQAQVANQVKELQILCDQAQKLKDEMDALRSANQTLEAEKQCLASNNQELVSLIDTIGKDAREAAKRLQNQNASFQTNETTEPTNAPPAKAGPGSSPKPGDAQ